MSYSKYSSVGFLLVILPMALIGQRAQENVVPLRNWATPLYWHPNQAGREAATQATSETGGPQLIFSANQVSNNALTFIAIAPCRLVDTRGGTFNGISPFSGPSIPATTTVTFPVQSATEASADTEPAPCGTIPSIAQAYSLNLTVVPVAGGVVDYISMWPSGHPQPFVATLNDPQGAIVANAAIVPAGTSLGGISVYNQGPANANVIIDMNGFFAAPSDLNGNTAIGALTLSNNTTGNDNTASGAGALYSNSTGSQNTAVGTGTLYSNTTGGDNVASGTSALQDNTTGFYNMASGSMALQNNTTGNNNTASGGSTLMSNTTGGNNTASGYQAMESNTTGNENTASGFEALLTNTTANNNTASGAFALEYNTTGAANTAFGAGALAYNTTGGTNIAIGVGAAQNVATGSNNIDIGNYGASGDGAAANSGVIRMGTEGNQTTTYIAGISGVTASGGSEVFINGNGQLGTLTSSRRFKEQITDMGDSSSRLFQLRPVTFLYKPQYDDGSHLMQYGLIAEEVEKVYPEMVVYDKDGQILTVRYQMLAPMLLNEVQKQNEQLQSQAKAGHLQQQENQKLEEQNRQLEDRLAALEALLTAMAARPSSSQ